MLPVLPMRHGVTASRLFLPKASYPSLLSFLLVRFPHLAEEVIRQRLERGDMVNAEGIPYHLNSQYEPETWIWYYREVEQEAKVPFDLPILYENERLIVVDKPHFLASIPGGRYLQETALTRLRLLKNDPHITPIHRLDRDTAGVLVFCRDPSLRGQYQGLFQTKQIKKVYEAIAPINTKLTLPLHYQSHLEKSPNYFTLQENPSREPNSQTQISLLQQGCQYALYQLAPVTGKKHQLRVHLNALNIPIVGDDYYPVLKPMRAADDFSNPLQLLARSLSFTDPVTAQVYCFTSQRQLDLSLLLLK